jgi:anti-sigma regulatory factor (Ser/Thr protein kinase)
MSPGQVDRAVKPPTTGRRAFPPEPLAVRSARQFAAESDAVSGVDLDLLALAVSELASNAVLHARTPFTVTVERLDDGVRVSVSDESPTIPRIRETSVATASGRGLRVVESVVRRWDVDTTPKGKTVWFELGWMGA